jgi:mannose-6-phosphate isomerase-like protein (cupin superfamily)
MSYQHVLVPPLSLTPTGEYFEFIASAREGGSFQFRWTLAPGKKGPPEHYHETESETFEVLAGEIRIWVGGVARDYRAGDSVTVPPLVAHRFLNAGKEPVVVNVTLDGTRMEDCLVPMAHYMNGRTRFGVRDLGRMLVHDVATAGSTSTNATMNRAMASCARLLTRFGVVPFSPIEDWEPATARGFTSVLS